LQVRLEDVSKRYGRIRALDHVSMDIAPGQIVSVLGANGAGKTTLLRCLSSIVAPDKGQILLDGEIMCRDRLDLRRRFTFLPDFPVMYGHMNPLQHIAMVLRLYEKDTVAVQDRAVVVLGNLDLLPLVGSRLAGLSRGQIYKTALAAMFIIDPELWILDEPLASGMDPVGIAFFKKECRAAAKRGRTVLYSTQLLDIAEAFSDRVCVLNRGKLELFEEVTAIQQRSAKTEGALEEVFLKLRSGGS
jgi:ABC-2 type transport system ATP-binding protein